jgi:serine/threonine-protein kinase HipA
LQFDAIALTLLRATRLMTRDQRQVEQAFTRCVFNVLFHNRDDHSKNFSFLLGQDGRWQLAPCYDLTFNAGMGGEHQMDIAGEGRNPARAHLLRLAQEEDIAPEFADATIERMASVAGQFGKLASEYPIRPATRKQIAQHLEQNRLRLI